jgi:hypothetical protein
VMKHTGCFFKNPMLNETHDFWRQWQTLKDYAQAHAGQPARACNARR